MDFATGAVASKAKAMYGKVLNRKDYQELLRKRSVSEIAGYLKNETDYQNVLQDVHEATLHRGQLEALMHRYVFEKTMRLVRFAGNGHKDFYNSYVIPQEIEQILNKIRRINSDIYEDFAQDVPIYLNEYTSFDLMKLDQAKNFDEILEVLNRTGYHKIVARFHPGKEKIIDYTGCELALRNYYFQQLKKAIDENFKRGLKKSMNTIVDTQIELENITRLYRYKKFFTQDGNELRSALNQSGNRMSDRFMEVLIAAPTLKVFLQELAQSPYHLFIDDQDYVFIEYDCEEICYHLAKRYMRFSNDAPLIFMVYLTILEIEVNNIINIIEGVRYKVSSENIEKMLIYTKGGA